MIFMISNRASYTKNGKRIFKNKGKERALPGFRVAECFLNESGKNVDYQILKGNTSPNFEALLATLKMEDSAAQIQAASNLVGAEAMLYELHQQATKKQGAVGDVLLFVPGYGNTLKKNRKQIFRLYKTYVEPKESPIEHLLFVTWPGYSQPLATYKKAQKDAVITGQLLAQVYEGYYAVFSKLFANGNAQSDKPKLHLAVSSMGNQILEAMLAAIAPTKLYSLFGEVLLLHADVENNVFEEGKPFTKLKNMAERVHIYIHKEDLGLLMSRFLKNFNKRLGKWGPSEATVLDEKVMVIDASKTKATRIGEAIIDHRGYLYRPSQIADILAVLKGDKRIITGRRIPNLGKIGHYILL